MPLCAVAATRVARPLRSLLLAGLGLLAACSDNGAGPAGDRELHFRGAQQPLAGAFEHDTGYLPESSPIQVRFVITARAGLEATATAKVSGGKLLGTAAGGAFSLDGAFVAQAQLKVDLPGIKFEGPLQGAPDIEITLADQTRFDPFLLDGAQARLSAESPSATVATIPLAGALSGVPGVKGDLVIDAGATMTSDFGGTCAAIADGAAQYTGRTRSAGLLLLSARVEIQVPLAGSQKVGPVEIEIPLPEVVAPLDLGVRALDGSDARTTAQPCAGVQPGDGGSPRDGGALDIGPLRPDGGGSRDRGAADAAADRDTSSCAVGTPEHCAGCGDACPGADSSSTARLCRAGQCDLECLLHYYDINGQAGDGCEFADATDANDAEARAKDLGTVKDCADPQTVAVALPSDERRHRVAPQERKLGKPKWVKLGITDEPACKIGGKITADLGALPTVNEYQLRAKYICSGGKALGEATGTGKGGTAISVNPSTSCSLLGLGDDGGTFFVELSRKSGTSHSAAEAKITLEP